MKKISAVCITYGRPSLLEEMVECFLRQQYPNKELIIVNDDCDIKFIFDHPQVKIFNVDKRFKRIGEKRNFACAKATGDIISIWDDDDIYLPRYLSIAVYAISSGVDYYNAHRGFMISGGELSLTQWNTYGAQMNWTRELFDMIGGYTNSFGSGEDQDIFAKTQLIVKRNDLFKAPVNVAAIDKLQFIYRWGGFEGQTNKHSHLSCKASQNEMCKEDIKGEFRINPHWVRDYCNDVEILLKTLNSKI